MSDLNQIHGEMLSYASCPDCGQVLVGREDDLFECITENHGPFRLAYERL